MGEADIAGTVQAFADAARRAVAAGYRVVELHAAHGYLLHQFLSPLSNRRNDAWGGDFDGRARLPLECARAVRAALPDAVPLAVRVSHTDWVEGGWTTEETVELSRRMKALGVDLLDVSSGGNDPRQRIPVGPGYQVPGADAVRRGAGVAVAAVGMITGAGAGPGHFVRRQRRHGAAGPRPCCATPTGRCARRRRWAGRRRWETPPQYERGWNTLGTVGEGGARSRGDAGAGVRRPRAQVPSLSGPARRGTRRRRRPRPPPPCKRARRAARRRVRACRARAGTVALGKGR
jgi:hypothetical protein